MTREFGIPKKRVTKVDPYEGQAVLIIRKTPENKGETYKFELSKQALVDLELIKENAADEKLVSFSFSEDELVIGNTTSLKDKIDSGSQYNVSMSGIFSNKDAHEYIIKELGLNPEIDNVLDVMVIEGESIPTAELIQLSVQETIKTIEDNIDENTMDDAPYEEPANENEAF